MEEVYQGSEHVLPVPRGIGEGQAGVGGVVDRGGVCVWLRHGLIDRHLDSLTIGQYE